MSLESQLRELREERLKYRAQPIPDSFQGITKAKISRVLRKIDRETDDMVDAVFALLDNEMNSLFSNAPEGTKFNEGATTAHIGSHIGILQRGANKLDREGRDYWIKPLRELGAIEAIYFDPETLDFLPGHPVPKSPNSGYRLSDELIRILQADEDNWQSLLDEWIKDDNVRRRAKLQAEAERDSRRKVDTAHRDLVVSCRQLYVPNFLPEYQILFEDVEDGTRVTSEEEAALINAGIPLSLADAMPDILLWHPSKDALWVIEAVTSDGEVDQHKINQIARLARQSGKISVGFTTAYDTWKDAARRQGQYKNIAPGTYIWIREDPSKHFHVVEMQSRLELMGLKLPINDV